MNSTEIKTIISELLQTLPVRIDSIDVLEEDGRAPIFVIKSPDSALLIGVRGASFQALSLLIKKIIETKAAAKKCDEPRFFIDVNDYRAGLARTLATKASILAERARSFKADVEMEPMSAYDRLIVHEYLSNAPNIKTESIGEGKHRRIVLRYVESQDEEVL